MLIDVKTSWIKSIVLLGLIMGSILLVKMTPVDISYSYDIREAHHQLK